MTIQLNEFIQHLRRTGLLQAAGELTDGQLLESFVSRREGAALEALVWRHGPMVWGVCRRVLRNLHDAEDAFQATFLVLVRKAASIAPREMVGNWLYGVARQTALKARATAAKRRERELQAVDVPEPVTKEPNLWFDLQPMLDRELSRLPDKYRAAIVLCDLEGKTRKEAARQLGVPDGTLAARVARARTMLAKRLARKGVQLSGGSVATILTKNAASACVPTALSDSTIKAMNSVVACQAATIGAISANVAALTNGVVKAMLTSKLKTAASLCFAVCVLLGLGVALGFRAPAADNVPSAKPKENLADTLILLDKQWWEAASKYDVDTLNKILADDWVAISPKGPQHDWNKAIYLDRCRKARFVDVKFMTERRVVRVDEHTAIMSYEVYWRQQEKGGALHDWAHDRMMSCWVQRDGGWFVKYTECVNLPVPNGGPTPAIAPAPVDQKIPPTIFVPTPVAQPEPAWKRGVRASGAWQNEIPENAFDGKRDTDFNSGEYAPAWIERDLGDSMPLTSITLFPCQDIPGLTVHEVWVSTEPIGNDRTKAKLVHTFKGETTNMQALKFEFPKDLSARYIEVRTTQSPTWIAWWEIEIRVRDEKVVPLESNAEPKQASNDRAALQGVWKVVFVETNGKEEKQPWLDRHRKEEWVVKNNFITVRSSDPSEFGVPHSNIFVVRPDKSPKEIDLNQYWVGLHLESDIEKGIYTLDGDTWKVCLPYSRLASPPKQVWDRPKEMATKEGGSTMLITLKRVK